jgi:hypothetical protein
MQIRNIVLYGRGGRVRQLELRTGALNIITGERRTGKSALLQIVEYCLGRNQYLVPAGVIRDHVLCYGLRLQFPDQQVFVAHPAPAPGVASNSAIYLEVGAEVAIPPIERIQPNANTTELTKFLTSLLNISPNLHEPPPGQTRLPLEATIRQALFLNFQQQGEVANPQFLFHRQGEMGVAQAIKDTLPYFLGAVAEDRLARQQELRQARRALANLERRLQEADLVRGEGLAKGTALLAEAVDVGIASSSPAPETAEAVIEQLTPIVAWSPQQTAEAAGDELDALQQVRAELQREYRAVQEKIRSTREFMGEQRGFAEEMVEQRVRLQSINLLPRTDGDPSNCPVCHSVLEAPTPSVAALQQSLALVSSQLAGVNLERPRLQDYADGLETTATDLRRRLAENRLAIESVVQQREAVERERDLDLRRARVAGRVSLYVESVRPADDREELLRQRDEARRRVEELQSNLEDTDTTDVLNSILNIVGRQMTPWATRLDLEYADMPLRIDLGRLSVVADTENGPVPLDQMGSGSNWLGYHLVSHLALHQWFIQKNRPVPRFLFLDQPSQVFYPPDRDADGSTDVLADDDRLAVHRMFRWLYDVVAALAPNFQIIVSDHADIAEEWFQNSVVERWRQGNALVPLSWITDGTEP